MTTLTKLLPPQSRPATILLKRAKHLALTHAQRQALPDHLDTAAGHVHHALHGHRALEVGDVLLDVQGNFWLVDAAPEALWQVRGPLSRLMQAAWLLGQDHRRAAVADEALLIPVEEALAPWLATLGLSTTVIHAPFTPLIAQPLVPEPVHAHDCGCGHDYHHHHNHDHHHHHHDHDHGPSGHTHT